MATARVPLFGPEKILDEATMLYSWLVWNDYEEWQIADAIAHPDDWAEELAQAIADLTGRDL